MNFMIQIDNTMTEDTIVLRACSRNKEYLYNVILHLQKNSTHMKGYDDMHNLYFITCQEIYYVESIDHKVYIYTKKNVYRCYLPFSKIKRELYNHGFCQINQNTLVNSIHIKSVHIEKDCHRSIILDNDECLIVNRRYRTVLDEQIE